jgi:hypothetical protein
MGPMSDNYRLLIETLPDAFAYHKIIADNNGVVVDYIFINVNIAFTEMFKLSKDKVIGKRITEVYPNVKESSFDWIGTFGKVALSGKNIHFEHFYEPLDRWYDITAYSDSPGYFAVVFRDITDKKQLGKLENKEKHDRDLSYQLFNPAKGGAPIKEKISIKQLIVENVKSTLSGSNIRPDYIIAEDLHMVEADEGQLSQVLHNIVINAVQAMPEGGIIEVRAENVTLEAGHKYLVPLPEGSYVKISIKDEGMGIPEKYLSKIFDPFFTTKGKERGLGLTIAYSIIKKHGGLMHVDSTLGVGTSVYIFLPAIA